MIDALILPAQRRALNPLARALHRRGVTADRISLTGFAVGIMAVPALALGWFWVALALTLGGIFLVRPRPSFRLGVPKEAARLPACDEAGPT